MEGKDRRYFVEWGKELLRQIDNLGRNEEGVLERRAEAERIVEERERLVALFATNPGLHARVMLTGRRFVHYLELEDLAKLHACILN